MQTILELEGLSLPAQVESFQPLQGGYILSGNQLALLHPFGYAKFYRHGFHSWSLSCWLDLDRSLEPPVVKQLYPQFDHPALLADYPFTGSGVGALQGPEGCVLILGALGLDARVKADDRVLRGSADSATGTPFEWFLGYGEEQGVFARYAELLSERLGNPKSAHPWQAQSPRVWCSWYSVFTNISEELILTTLEGLQGLPFDVFQIDDGWQVSIGDWAPNPKFPSGMLALARSIRGAGYVPGLWLAPLIVQPKSSTFQYHSDWLLRDAQGQPVPAGHNWGDVFYALDVTLPAVQDWLTELIQNLVGWGYGYLKLDFLYASALPGVRHVNLPGEAAFRLGLEVIRKAAGDAYLLVCGAPVLASLGLADGMRIGPDVAPYWDNPERSQHLHDHTGPGTLNAIRTCLGRLWLRPLVQIDPDVTFFRTRYNLLLSHEMDLLRTLTLITGFRATSDLPFWLDPGERQALNDFLVASPQIERLSYYRFRVAGQEVDFDFVKHL
jgi:alpha-galactosidase